MMLEREEELARALAPSLARHLLASGGEPVLLLGGDVIVAGRSTTWRGSPARTARCSYRAATPRSPTTGAGPMPPTWPSSVPTKTQSSRVAGDGRGACRLVGARSSRQAGSRGAKERPIFDVAAAEFRHARVR